MSKPRKIKDAERTAIMVDLVARCYPGDAHTREKVLAVFSRAAKGDA